MAKTEKTDTTEPVEAPKVDGALQARWVAFLATCEAEAVKNGTTHIFEAQKERGEFDVIPSSFTDNHFIH